MRAYYRRTFREHLRRGRTLYLLTGFGVALGVASVLCIQILNRSALGAFEGSVRAISGESDLSVLGRFPLFPERLYPEVLAVEGVAAAWPLYRVDVALGRDSFLEIVGFDLFAPVRLPVEGAVASLTDPIAVPGWVAVTPELAGEMGWTVGDRVGVSNGTRVAELTVGALVDFRRVSPLASRRLAVMDIGQAQSLLGEPGRINQIDVQVRPGAVVGEVAARLQRSLGDAVRVVTPEQREQDASRLLGAFRLNLTALSLISLLVGAFLVFTSTEASLVRRRAEFGLLRSLGASRGQVLRLILFEIAVLGLLGVLVGIPLGYAAAAANVEMVSGTVSNLYQLEAIESLDVPAWLYLMAIGVGLGGAVAGALLPALDMSRRDSRSLLAAYTLHERTGSAATGLFALGAALLAGVAIWYAAFGTGWRPAGFVLAVVLVIALPMLAPLAVRSVGRAGRIRGFGFAYALHSLVARLQVTSFAVASLAVAVSMLVGITLMVGSFRQTLETWIRSSVRADVYVTSESASRMGADATLSPDLVDELAGWAGVRAVDRLRRFPAWVGERQVMLAGMDMSLEGGAARFVLLEGDAATAERRVAEEEGALISEPLSRATGLGVGDRIPLAGPAGEASFPVIGVFYDYGNERGAVFLDLAALEPLFGPGPPHAIGLYLEKDRDPERMVQRVRATFPDLPLRVRSNRRLREDVFRVFDQTFAITRFLELVCLAVAVCGITLTLLILARERISELALYRALGARRRQIFRIFLGKGMGIAVLGIGLGLAGGIALAAILIFVINRAWFGWTIQVHWPWTGLAAEMLLILLAAAAASLYPAARASRTPATELSREEVA